jgi:hypothetical protein
MGRHDQPSQRFTASNCGKVHPTNGQRAMPEGLKVGEPAPPIKLKDLQGKTVELKDFQG